MSTTISMPNRKSKSGSDEDEARVSQARQPLKRFRVLVDRQMKSSFDKEEEATRVASAIKKAHPVVTVSVYDAEKSASKDVD
jgi:hypothetical protein